MAPRCAKCSIEPLVANRRRPTSARIMIRCTDSTNGRRICESSTWKPSRRCRTYVPLSHPFVERLIGTIRRECLDRTLFWTAADLELKLPESSPAEDGARSRYPFVSLAAALSWALSRADGGVRCGRERLRPAPAKSGRVDRL